MAAFSLIELLFVLGLAAIFTGIAVPSFTAALDDMRAASATRYIASRLLQARMEAASRMRDTGVRFTAADSGYTFAVYVDGNRNGVLTRDIEEGIDVPVGWPERLTDHFPGVDFGTAPGLPAVVAEDAPPGTDPIRLGSGNLATFTGDGTSSTGSLYIRGRSSAQYVIRLFGQTGKIRILRFNSASRRWQPL